MTAVALAFLGLFPAVGTHDAHHGDLAMARNDGPCQSWLNIKTILRKQEKTTYIIYYPNNYVICVGRLGPFKQLVDFSCRFGEWSTWPKPWLPQTFRISHASTEVKLRLTEIQLNRIREYSRCVTACCQMIEL